MKASTYLKLARLVKALFVGVAAYAVGVTVVETVKDTKEEISIQKAKRRADRINEARAEARAEVKDIPICEELRGHEEEYREQMAERIYLEKRKELLATDLTKEEKRKIFIKALPKCFVANAKEFLPLAGLAVTALSAMTVGKNKYILEQRDHWNKLADKWDFDGGALNITKAFAVLGSTAVDNNLIDEDQGYLFYRNKNYDNGNPSEWITRITNLDDEHKKFFEIYE